MNDVPVDAAALQAEDVPEADARPLRVLHPAIAALGVPGQRLDDGLVLHCHLHHLDGVFSVVNKLIGCCWLGDRRTRKKEQQDDSGGTC